MRSRPNVWLMGNLCKDNSFNRSGRNNLFNLFSFAFPYFRYCFFDIVDAIQGMVCTRHQYWAPHLLSTFSHSSNTNKVYFITYNTLMVVEKSSDLFWYAVLMWICNMFFPQKATSSIFHPNVTGSIAKQHIKLLIKCCDLRLYFLRTSSSVLIWSIHIITFQNS